MLKTNKKKVIAGHAVFAVLLAAILLANNQNVSIYMEAWESTDLLINQKTKIDVNINADIPINAVGAIIDFPEDKIDILAISKENSFFDLWTEETTIMEEDGKILFSGGSFAKGGVTGPKTILTLTIRAKNPGEALFFFEDVVVLASDGKGTNVLNKTSDLNYFIKELPESSKPEEKPEPPSPDLNEDGKVNLVDISIISTAMFKNYDSRFDLNMDGSVNITDLSIIVSEILQIR